MGELELAAACAAATSGASAGERRGRLEEPVVEALRRAGLFKALLPADLGGLGLGLPEACAAFARLAEADGAAGWAAMIASGAGWFAGTMPPELGAEVFGPAEAVVAGSGAVGVAEPGEGGWQVLGRWRWCSGAPWATWFTFAVSLPGGGLRGIAVPAGEVAVDPASWDVRGMQATASWDAALDGQQVPERHTFALDGPPHRPEPFFAVPFPALAQATMAAVSVGVARRLLAEFAALARSKQPRLATAPLAEEGVVRHELARAHAATRAAGLLLDEATAAVWGRVLGGEAVPPRLAAELQAAAAHAAATGAEAGHRLARLAGMDALERGSALARAVADLDALRQNAVQAAARFTDAGAELLGP